MLAGPPPAKGLLWCVSGNVRSLFTMTACLCMQFSLCLLPHRSDDHMSRNWARLSPHCTAWLEKIAWALTLNVTRPCWKWTCSQEFGEAFVDIFLKWLTRCLKAKNATLENLRNWFADSHVNNKNQHLCVSEQIIHHSVHLSRSIQHALLHSNSKSTYMKNG